MLVKIIGAVVLVLALFLGYVAMKPDGFSVTREVIISTTPTTIFPNLDVLSRLNVWNPWLKGDPKATITYAGPDSGIGATTSWEGQDSGAGTSTITESLKDQVVRVKTEFLKPFPGHVEAEYVLKAEGQMTKVTWTIFGKNSFVPKLMGTFFSVDRMMGDYMIKGLNDLKAIAEASPTIQAAPAAPPAL